MGKGRKRHGAYSAQKRAAVLARLEANGGNASKTARETGVAAATVKRWSAESGAGSEGAGAGDLGRFSKDSWTIIHKANRIVREGIEELGAKDAASIASGYFDRQSKAEDRLAGESQGVEEYAAEWDGAKK